MTPTETQFQQLLEALTLWQELLQFSTCGEHPSALVGWFRFRELVRFLADIALLYLAAKHGLW